jgi:hypothetical protein
MDRRGTPEAFRSVPEQSAPLSAGNSGLASLDVAAFGDSVIRGQDSEAQASAVGATT